jgi:hypothetical protein
MVARAVAFVKVAVSAKVQQIELVNQAVALKQIYGAVHGDASDARIDFLGALENFAGIQVAARGLHNLQQDAALASEPDSARAELVLQASWRLVVDALTSGNTMCGSGRHDRADIIPKRWGLEWLYRPIPQR